ncbi:MULTISPECIES: hypothetical protein [Anaerosinus]|uniref:Uncharacterized protein n=1 Tax=Selenobaculum gibii TaxID=3054208 RepID=A0A9Y2AKH5_9FIRM|nr:hypothetical protein [Selenobaculum gbiensis]WIW71632.1 hypothetical protein P3F81_04835 [Selenobaculum gbiensis]
MEISPNLYALFAGFLVWFCIAPKARCKNYGNLFAAYTMTMALTLVGTADLIIIKPIAFFFTVGGVFAFFYVLFTRTIQIIIKIGNE